MNPVQNIKLQCQDVICQISILTMRGFFTATVIDSHGTDICEERIQGEFDHSMINEAVALAAFRAGVELQNERKENDSEK